MDKVTNGTEPRGEAIGAVPSVESLLNSQAFRERLEEARRQREKALDLRRDAAPDAILAATRPWERADPQEIQRRRALKPPAAGARPAPQTGPEVEPGARIGPEPATMAGPRSGFAALAGAMAAGQAAISGGPSPSLPATPTARQAPASTDTALADAAVPETSVIVLRPASKEALGDTMVRAAAAMAALAEAEPGQNGVTGVRVHGPAGPGRPAARAAAWPAEALPLAVPPATPGRSRALLVAGGFALGLTIGAALAWVFARPVPVPAPSVPGSAAVVPAAPAPAVTGHPLTGVIDVAARAPSLPAPADGGAEAGPAASPVTAVSSVRLAPAALPAVAAAPGPIPHTPDPLTAPVMRGAAAPAVPAGPVTLAPPIRQAPAELVASVAAGPAPRADATPQAPASVAAPRQPALPKGEVGTPVVKASLPAGRRGASRGAPALAVPLSSALAAVAPPGATAAVPALADRAPMLPVPGPAPDSAPGRAPGRAPGQTASVPGAVQPKARLALAAAPGAAAPLPDALPRAVPAPLAPPAPSYAGISLHVHAPGSVGDDALGRIAADLAAVGFSPNPVARVGFTVRETQVRFFHAADAAAAAVLAGATDAAVRDFTGFRPSPPEGTLELWLEGGAGGGSAAKPARAEAPSDPLAARKRALRDLLVEQLRRGDHL